MLVEISLPSCSPVEGMQAPGRCWFASCTGLCVCAGYEGRCCLSDEDENKEERKSE